MAHVDDLEVQRANARFIRRSMRAPMLSREREVELARRWRAAGDAAALHELIAAYGRLVVAAATRFRGYGLPLGDLIQEGHVGLMQAAARFDADRGVRFSTYAGWWIRSAMQDFILRNWSIVRTGTTAAQKSLFFNLRRLRARLADPSGAGMSPEQRLAIAQALHVPPAEVAAMEQRLSGAAEQVHGSLGLVCRVREVGDLVGDFRQNVRSAAHRAIRVANLYPQRVEGAHNRFAGLAGERIGDVIMQIGQALRHRLR